MGAPTKRTDARREAIFRALRDGRGYGGAAAAVGISRRHFEQWRHDDPESAQLCEDAREDTVDLVEHRLFRDAMAGNTLAQLAYLRAYRPERFYRKMMIAVGGDPNAPPIATTEETGAMIYPRPELRRELRPTIEAVTLEDEATEMRDPDDAEEAA
jgi:hypothetical protein